jgi:hypothetical protein
MLLCLVMFLLLCLPVAAEQGVGGGQVIGIMTSKSVVSPRMVTEHYPVYELPFYG